MEIQKKMREQSTIADCPRLPILWEENTEINIALLLIYVNTIKKVFQLVDKNWMVNGF